MAVNKNSVLLTGDIVLNGERLNRIQAHLGNKRWKSLHVMQIPHHGSRNNWEVGTASHCAHTHSVFCAPGTAKHPDKQVTLDLATRNPVVANYEDAICFDFHTK